MNDKDARGRLGWRITCCEKTHAFGPKGVWVAEAYYVDLSDTAHIQTPKPDYHRSKHAETEQEAREGVLALCRADTVWPLMLEP